MTAPQRAQWRGFNMRRSGRNVQGYNRNQRSAVSTCVGGAATWAQFQRIMRWMVISPHSGTWRATPSNSNPWRW